MFVKLLKSKLHRATVTATKLHYPGSIAIDPELMETAGIFPYEAVTIADVDNGNRLETYVIPAEAGSRDVIVMGAAAQLIHPKDIVIIFSFGLFVPGEVEKHKPKVFVFGEKNKIRDAE